MVAHLLSRRFDAFKWVAFLAAACLILSSAGQAEDMSALQKAKWHKKAYSNLPEVYGPGKIVYMPLPRAGEDLRQELENITFSYRYTEDYQANRFDCSDMSMSLWYLLHRNYFCSRACSGHNR